MTGQTHATPSSPPGRAWAPDFDARSLAAFRWAFGLTLLVNLYIRTSHGRLDAFFTDAGVLPLDLLRRGNRWSFLDSFSSPESARIAIACIAAVFVAYTAGFLTQYAKWLVVICLVALYHRNPLIDDGSDWVMRLVALWTALLPLGERYSIDALRRGARRDREHRSRVAVVGITLNLAASYCLNALQKDGQAWISGDALRLVLWDPWVVGPIGAYIRNSGDCDLLRPLTYLSLIAEQILACALVVSLRFSLARGLVAVLMLVLHSGFGAVLILGTLVPLYLSLALVFVPGRLWDRFGAHSTSAGPQLRRSLTAEAAALLILIWCSSLIVRNNPIFPDRLRRAVEYATPAAVERWSQLLVITQEWLMLKSPESQLGTVMIAARAADGTLTDPFRGAEYDVQAPFTGSSYLGKYWASYFYRLAMDGYANYRPQLLRYIFSRGFDSVEVSYGEITAPAVCGVPPSEVRSRTLFRAWRPVVFVPRLKDVRPTETDVVAVVEQEMSYYGPYWTDSAQLHAVFDRAHSYLTAVFDSPHECNAEAQLAFTRAPDYGRFSIRINESPELQVDLYSQLGVLRQISTMSRIPLHRGENRLRIELAEVSAAGRSKFGIDRITLNCLE